MPIAAPNARYFQVFEGTLELIGQLEAFVRGETTREALQAWAHELWRKDGTQEGPL